MMLNVRLAGNHEYWKLLFTWLSLVMSLMVAFCAVPFPRDVYDDIWDFIDSVCEGFPIYFFILHSLSLSSFSPFYRPDASLTDILLKRT